MAKKKMSKVVKQETPAQRLSKIIKTCRNTMRKDKGLNGDADRLPMLTWIMFLKFLDDNEQLQEVNAQLESKKYKPAISNPYRWRDWAKDISLTGDDLLSFISNEKVKGKDKKVRLGLFYYLRSLQSETGTERKDVIATVFKGVQNRMINGYLLRDVIDEIDKIHFTNNEEINTLSHLYESILKEMRDASGDSGEFYTPRPVVRFMVEMIDPRIGETVLDPASGTGGFLVEAFEYLKKQAKTLEHKRILQNKSIFGGEPKPLPYMLCQMNLLLHGINFPNIDSGNSLRFPIRDIGDKDRVDVIITNPPFGGEEEKGILNNFPEDKKTNETALLFLQLIMRKLKRSKAGVMGGRAAVIVPNGTLFEGGVASRIKKQLLEEFNLHTIVRLPEGVFEPYTDIVSNILFFDSASPTDKIWYYEVFPPEGVKTYSKTKPLQPQEFGDLIAWWKNRKETKNAWIQKASDLLSLKNGEVLVNLDSKNPHIKLREDIIDPANVLAEIIKKQSGTINDLQNLQIEIFKELNSLKILPRSSSPLSKILIPVKETIKLKPKEQYKQIKVRLEHKGVLLRGLKKGADVGSNQFLAHKGDFIISKIDARNGAMGFVPEELDGAVVTNDFPLFQLSQDVDPNYFSYFSRTNYFDDACKRASEGSTNRKRLKLEKFYQINISLPLIDDQRRIVSILNRVQEFRSLFNDIDKKLITVEKFFIREIFNSATEEQKGHKIDHGEMQMSDQA